MITVTWGFLRGKTVAFSNFREPLKNSQTVCPNFIYYIPETIIGFYNNLQAPMVGPFQKPTIFYSYKMPRITVSIYIRPGLSAKLTMGWEAHHEVLHPRINRFMIIIETQFVRNKARSCQNSRRPIIALRACATGVNGFPRSLYNHRCNRNAYQFVYPNLFRCKPTSQDYFITLHPFTTLSDYTKVIKLNTK